MLTFRKGTAGTPTAAQAMADHLSEQTLPTEMEAMAEYYLRGVKRAEAEGTAAMPRQDMPLAVAEALGIVLNRTLTKAEVVNLLRGVRADGEAIEGKKNYKVAAGKDRISYVDFTFSAPKSVSIAMALAPTDAERHMIVGAHRDAVMAGMAHLETIVAHARKGEGGSKGSIPGKLGWVTYDHYTARPTIEIPHSEADGTRTTLIQSVRNPKVAGDMQLHTHVTTPNVVVCDDGTVGSMDMLAMHDRVHEVGAYYQAHLATNLRAHGIDVVLDQRTDTARVAAVPQEITEVFSKRTKDGEAAARDYVAAQGLDWDAMHPMELAGVLKGGTRATRRQKETGQRGDDMTDLAAWKAQAKAAGYEHASVIDPEVKARPAPTEQERLLHGYKSSLPVLARQFESRATMYASVARTAAARGLIASGVDSAADIDKITAAMREHGVQHAGKQVPLMWAEVATEGEDATAGGRRPRVKITTTLHVAQEEEAMRLATKAAADRGGALQPDEIERAVAHVSRRDGLDFTSEHGAEQRRIIDALGTSGRFAVAVGVGGAGKTTLLRPLVEAWSAPVPNVRPGREVYGTALAWRQSDPLADAGIKPENTMAIAALLARARADKLHLDHNSVVVVDELSQVGTTQALGLLRLQAVHGFAIVAIGDDKQAQAIEAGNTIALLRKALGTEAVPELESTVRQLRDRDKETSLMFRQGDAAGGITRLREDGHAMLVPGGHRHAVAAVADLWEARQRENAGREGYTLTVSAPTNADARAISSAIRTRRRKAGEVGADQVTIKAADQNRAEYDLPLAVGDRVRLFARTPAAFGGKGGNLGNNGSVVQVERIEANGLQLRNAKGNAGFVKWDTLRDPANGRVRLTYGDVITIDAIQSATSTEHINAMPSGSEAVQSFKAYVAQSRSRETTFLVVADGRERTEIIGRRALGNVVPITEDDVWANVARNLSRQPTKELATDLLNRAREMNTGTVRSLATAFQPGQQRQATGGPPPDLRSAFNERRAERDVAGQAPAMDSATAQNTTAAREVARRLTGPGEVRKAAIEARRAMRPAASRPKKGRSQPIITPTEAQAEFADALHRAGLRLPGAPIMDGQKHRVPVEGSRKSKSSGVYVGHLDGHPAGYARNHQTGDEVRWKASRPAQEMTPEQRDRARAQAAADRAAKEAARRRAEVAASHKALAIWNRAKPVQAHSYLARKDVASHGLRQDRRGNLLVPMRDVEGRLWNLQTITPDGDKFYMKDARREGTHALLGDLQPGQLVMVLEGYATGATMLEVTGIAAAVAFDSGNLENVARAYRKQDPARPIVFPSDNDHHLPRREKPLPNVGQVKAEAAAKEVGGVVLQPPFMPTDAGTDWNDYAAQHGKAATQALVQAEIRKHGFEMPAEAVKVPQAAPGVTQAMRDAARQTAGRAVQAPDQGAREAARHSRQRLAGPRL